MSDRPAPIALTDLAHPQFSAEAKSILDLMADAGQALSLQPDALLQAAEAETGLHDYGNVDFILRLNLLCETLQREGRLNAAGTLAQQVLLIGLLRNRLLIEDLVARHPEILHLPVERPIIICGLPRTGTTHLHNLMSSDVRLRSLPYWESTEPVLPVSEQSALVDPDPRLERTAAALGFLDVAMPEFKRMHEMTVEHVHEEIQLLAIDFSTMLFETTAAMPTWRDHYLERDQRPTYAYLRKTLQVLQWLRGGTRWVLKSPQHLEQFPALRDTFPDATFIVTHRDPVSVTASMVTMIAYTARLVYDDVDLPALGAYWSDRLRRMLQACVDERDVLPTQQSMDLHFDEFMRDDLAMARLVYELADQPFDETAAAAMSDFMVHNPRGRHGAVLYDLDQFGLDADALRRDFRFYIDRFGITEEG